MGYLIDGDDSVMHEGMVRGSTPWPGSSHKLVGRIEGSTINRRTKLWVLTLRVSNGKLDWVSMESVIWEGSCTSMSKWEAMVGGSTSHTPGMAGRGWHDELPDGCGKSVLPMQRVKTIRIAESSDMDNWETVLRPCASFKKGFEFFFF